MSKNVVFSIILFVLIAVVLEVSSYLVIERVLRPYGVYYVAEDTPRYSSMQKNWHPEFGWPNPKILGPPTRDESGARVNPYFPELTRPCISIYGESAVFGSEVEDQDAWSNVLSAELGCRIANYGVRAYGLDQALLRFRGNAADRSGIVMMGAPPSVISRHVNQFRVLLPHTRRSPGQRPLIGLKPRFVLNESGDLEFVELPLDPLTREAYGALVEAPEESLQAEYFQVNGETGLSRKSFPYTLSLIRGMNHFLVRSRAVGKEWYADLYEENHSSGAQELTAALYSAFHDEAIASGRRPLVLLFPTAESIEDFRAGEGWLYQSLMDKLDQLDIPYLNIGEGMVARIGDRDACEFYYRCIPHANAEGSKIIAEIVQEYLAAHTALYPITSPPPVEAVTHAVHGNIRQPAN